MRVWSYVTPGCLMRTSWPAACHQRGEAMHPPGLPSKDCKASSPCPPPPSLMQALVIFILLHHRVTSFLIIRYTWNEFQPTVHQSSLSHSHISLLGVWAVMSFPVPSLNHGQLVEHLPTSLSSFLCTTRYSQQRTVHVQMLLLVQQYIDTIPTMNCLLLLDVKYISHRCKTFSLRYEACMRWLQWPLIENCPCTNHHLSLNTAIILLCELWWLPTCNLDQGPFSDFAWFDALVLQLSGSVPASWSAIPRLEQLCVPAPFLGFINSVPPAV